MKNLLNEEQDPKAVEKITSKLNDLLMKNEEISYIGVQKKPAITVFPDSIVLTNKRIIICKPKNLGLSMDFTDYPWDTVAGVFVKENILGSEFSFSTSTDMTVSIDYIPKTQARKIYTFAKEQLEILKENANQAQVINNYIPQQQSFTATETLQPKHDEVEEMETEEVTDFTELIDTRTQQVPQTYNDAPAQTTEQTQPVADNSLANLTKEELFEKLQNYKKLLDNGLILQGEYDALKKEVIAHL